MPRPGFYFFQFHDLYKFGLHIGSVEEREVFVNDLAKFLCTHPDCEFEIKVSSNEDGRTKYRIPSNTINKLIPVQVLIDFLCQKEIEIFHMWSFGRKISIAEICEDFGYYRLNANNFDKLFIESPFGGGFQNYFDVGFTLTNMNVVEKVNNNKEVVLTQIKKDGSQNEISIYNYNMFGSDYGYSTVSVHVNVNERVGSRGQELQKVVLYTPKYTHWSKEYVTKNLGQKWPRNNGFHAKIYVKRVTNFFCQIGKKKQMISLVQLRFLTKKNSAHPKNT
jgi:hypothetical protein